MKSPIRAGEQNPNTQLTQWQVTAIRVLYAADVHDQSELAAMFEINQSQVSRIVRGLAWPGKTYTLLEAAKPRRFVRKSD